MEELGRMLPLTYFPPIAICINAWWLIFFRIQLIPKIIMSWSILCFIWRSTFIRIIRWSFQIFHFHIFFSVLPFREYFPPVSSAISICSALRRSSKILTQTTPLCSFEICQTFHNQYLTISTIKSPTDCIIYWILTACGSEKSGRSLSVRLKKEGFFNHCLYEWLWWHYSGL